MMSNFFTVYVFFRLLNTSIIFVFFYYVCKHYIYPWAFSLVKVHSEEVSSLLEEQASLQSSKQSLERDISREKQYTQHVHELVENWNEQISRSICKRSEEKKTIDRAIQEYFSQRSQEISKQAMIQKIASIVLHDVAKDLKEQFESDVLGSEYVKEIVRYCEAQRDIV